MQLCHDFGKCDCDDDECKENPHLISGDLMDLSSSTTLNDLTVRSLLGPDASLPDKVADASLFHPSTKGSANVLRMRNPQLSPLNHGWEKITLIVDSGASDTVMPPKVCRAAEIRHSSKVGTEYEVADGGVAKNLGEKLCELKLNEGDADGMEIAFQVVDKVNKALLSVHRVCQQGHDVVFSETKGNLSLIHI